MEEKPNMGVPNTPWRRRTGAGESATAMTAAGERDFFGMFAQRQTREPVVSFCL
jgi:hypothetical protein